MLNEGLSKWPNSRVAELLGIKYPLILAPMHQAITNEILGTPELVAAVSNAGGLGIFGSGTLPPEELRKYIKRIKQLTDKPFGINLLVPYAHKKKYKQNLDKKIEFTRAKIKKMAQEIGLEDCSKQPAKRLKRDYDTEMFPHFSKKLDVCIEERVLVVQFAFAAPSFEAVFKCQRNGITTMGTCTSLAEALELQRAGVNMLVVQGCEAGGQRASFMGSSSKQRDKLGTFVLVPQLTKAITSIPIIACGGVMDGRGVTACLALGAEGVMMGTAFMKAHECGISADYRKILDENEETQITRSFTGRPVRAIANRYVQELEQRSDMIPEFPIQHNIAADTMRRAVKEGKLSMIPIFVGQGYRLGKEAPAQEIFFNIVADVQRMLT